jgi:3-dehydroquinate dehydratase-2
MPKPIYILSGPNLNLLGVREPHIYGSTTLEQIAARLEARAREAGYGIVSRQTNFEGELVAWIQEARTEASALVLNAAAYTHTSVAVLDSLKMLDIPSVECHLSNPHAREAFRHHSYVSYGATAGVFGFGPASYEIALEGALRLIQDRAAKAAGQA